MEEYEEDDDDKSISIISKPPPGKPKKRTEEDSDEEENSGDAFKRDDKISEIHDSEENEDRSIFSPKVSECMKLRRKWFTRR